MTKEELIQNKETALKAAETEEKVVSEKYQEIVKKWLTGLSTDFKVKMGYVWNVVDVYLCDCGEYPGDDTKDFSLTFDKDYKRIKKDDGTYNYETANVLRISFSSWGHCDTNHPDILKYYSVIGKITENLGVMKTDFEAVDTTKRDELHKAFNDAGYALSEFLKEEEKNKKDAFKKEVVKHLVEGSHIIIGTYPTTWNEEKDSYNFAPDVRKIVKVMPKNILIEGKDYRIKIDDLVEKIRKGDWYFAEKMGDAWCKVA